MPLFICHSPRRPALRMPFALSYPSLDMALILGRRFRLTGPVAPPVTGLACRDDVIGTISPAFASGGQMFRGASQGQSKSSGQVISDNELIETIVPHGHTTIMAMPVLTVSGFEFKGL